jgi:hypothetical protein
MKGLVVVAILVSCSAMLAGTPTARERAASDQSTTPIRVFVTSVGAVNGLTDPNKDNQDTMKDLRDSLKGRKGLVVTDKREDAAIVLVVMSREKAQITAGVFGASRDCTVRVKFIYDGSETEMSASAQGGTLASGGAWSKAAGKVAKQVEEWVKTNRANLSQAR